MSSANDNKSDAPRLPLWQTSRAISSALPIALFGLFWCAITGMFVAIVVMSIARSIDANLRFATTDGTILASELTRVADDEGDGDTYKPKIRYRYHVDGREYTSVRYDLLDGSTSAKSAQQAIVDRHPVGSTAVVYYDPDDPSRAVLDRSVSPMMWFLLLFLQPFILVGAGFLVAVFLVPARKIHTLKFLAQPMQLPWQIPTWGTARCEGSAVLIQPRDKWTARAAFAAEYGAACFVSVFAVGGLMFLAEISSPLPVVGAFILAGLAGRAAMRAALKRSRAKSQLLIDPNLGILKLTSPKRDVRLALRDIACWAVGHIANPRKLTSDSDLSTAPLLVVRTLGGEETPVHVFKPSRQAREIADKVAREMAKFTGVEVGDGDVRGHHDEPTRKNGAARTSRAAKAARRARQIARSKEGDAQYSDLT